MEKSENAPNAPQARPIEIFWALCKEKYRQNKRIPKNIRAFKKRWKDISTLVALNSGRELMARARPKLLEISNFGV